MTATAPKDISPQLIERFIQHGPQWTQPEPSCVWADVGSDADYRAALQGVSADPEQTLALYLHIPFCPGRCLYCGCNTTVTHDTARIDGYLDTLEREIEMVADVIGGERDVVQLHVAGGTPNYLNDAQLTRLTEMYERRFRILPETDAAIECDPRRTSAGQLELLHALGFRRITFGVQDLAPAVQRAIGRIQSIELVRDVYWMAREIGFDSIGFDLIYGLPEQTEESFQATLDAVLEMAPDRVACFGYSRGADRDPHQHAIDIHRLPSELDRQVLFHHAVRAFTGNGYSWIGLDVFSLETDELAIAQEEGRLHRNCIGYTATPATQLLGFGTGAVGEVDGYCIQNASEIADWQAAVDRGRLPVARSHRLDGINRRRRDAIAHLICNQELPERLARGCLDDEYRRLAGYASDGLVEISSDRLRVTPTGRYFLRSLCTEHDAYFEWDRARWHFSRTN
jgi:oxygen-independent coproporphyrinogen-3 oxidase